MSAPEGDKERAITEVLSDADARMGKAVKATRRELSSLRSGRASPSLLDNVTVDYYGVSSPLNQLASISAPEARLLVVQPWDKASLQSIEKSLMSSDLGLNPSNDGNVVRVPIPPLTQERREELVRVLRRKVEEGRVAVRNIRRDYLEELRDLERNKATSQDEVRRAQEQLQRITDAHIDQIEQLSSAKEVEILEV